MITDAVSKSTVARLTEALAIMISQKSEVQRDGVAGNRNKRDSNSIKPQ